MSSTSIHLKGHATTPIHPDPGSLVNVHTLETKSLINQEFFCGVFRATPPPDKPLRPLFF